MAKQCDRKVIAAELAMMNEDQDALSAELAAFDEDKEEFDGWKEWPWRHRSELVYDYVVRLHGGFDPLGSS